MKCYRSSIIRTSLGLLLCAVVLPGCMAAATDWRAAPADGVAPQAVVDVLRSDSSLEVTEDPDFYQGEYAAENQTTLFVTVARGEALTLVEIWGHPPEIRVLTCLLGTPDISERRDAETGELEIVVEPPGVTEEEMADMLELQDHVIDLITDAFPEIEIGTWRRLEYVPAELE